MKNTIIDPQNHIFQWKDIEHNDYKYITTCDYYVQTEIRPENSIKHKFFSIGRGGLILISKGYCWDGASGPTIDTENTIRASCVHDVLYQAMREKLLPLSHRKNADKELSKIMLEDSKAKSEFHKWFNGVRAGYYYWAVRFFAYFAAKPKT